MRLLALLFLLCLLPVGAFAADALSGDTIKLDDGRVVRLLGVKAVGDAAKAQLENLITGHELITKGNDTDRYGRIAADVYTDKLWLQGELLKQGLAFVYPPTGTEPHIVDLLKGEKEARQAKLGIWGDNAYADKPAAEPEKIGYGHFAFVSGKVAKAERIKNRFYLNFGTDWHEDFTVAIEAHDLRAFHNAHIDPQSFEGKTVRVRGWVKHDFGPMIMVTNPAQIETLEQGGKGSGARE